MDEQHQQMIADSVKPLEKLDKDAARKLSPIAESLFRMIYDDLGNAILGNPIEHHSIVLGHMIEIAAGEKSPYIPYNQATALALLHDISSVRKITTQMVADERARDAARADALELERQQNRILHMREGSAMAHRYLLKLNQELGKVVFDGTAIDAICEVVRIHDNPSLDICIPRYNWLAVAFREADRLWMVTHLGILADLARKEDTVQCAQAGDEFRRLFSAAYAAQIEMNEAKIADPPLYRKQLEKNMQRFQEERSLYRPYEFSEGPFCDDVTFFRTSSGYKIFKRLCEAAYERLESK